MSQDLSVPTTDEESRRMSTPPGWTPAVAGTDHDIPVCPRHPDTPSYVRCQRCSRPACTRCQVPASVGFQCVDCVAQEKRQTPVPAQRSELGFEQAPGRPVVTIAIIAICAVVWIGELTSPSFFYRVAFFPVLGQDEPWRFVTAGFAHDRSSPLHLLFNMYALYVVGQYLEPLLGRVRFAALFLISVIGGSVGYELLSSAPTRGGDIYSSGWVTPLVGASGGVFGLFLAIVVLNRHLGREIRPMLVLIGINVVLGFTMPNVAWQAHLGGAVAGAIAAGLLYALRRRPRAMQYGALAALVVLLFVIAYVRFRTADVGWIHIVT